MSAPTNSPLTVTVSPKYSFVTTQRASTSSRALSRSAGRSARRSFPAMATPSRDPFRARIASLAQVSMVWRSIPIPFSSCGNPS